MITIRINTDNFNLPERLDQFLSPEGQGDLLRAVSLSMLPVVHDRIHVAGQAADGSQIGTYSKGYMVVRTGNYKNSVKFSKGKKKGEVKNSGKFTRGDKSGLLPNSPFAQARPNYNRSSDTKVVLSLTRQMEDDFSVVAEGDKYGLGFKNEHNYDKANWAEANYNKKIFSLSQRERDFAIEAAQEYTDAVL